MYYYEISDKSFLEKGGYILLHNLKYKSFLENKKHKQLIYNVFKQTH